MAFALYRYLRSKRGTHSLWRSAVRIGLSIGIFRAVLACVGWYGVEHTGGPLQTPAFALAMLAWPEGIVFGSHKGVMQMPFYFALGFLLIATSLLFVCGVALVARATGTHRDP